MAKRTGDKYQTIIDAAVKVIAQHGYHQAQVSKIAREAKVADGTIYLYFDSKEDILLSLFSEKMGRFIARAKQHIEEERDIAEQLRTLVYMHFHHLSQDQDLAVVTQLELRQSDAQLRRNINAVLKQYLVLIDDILKRGQEQRVFDLQQDILPARYMIFGTLDESVTNWVMKDCKYDLVSLVDPIHNLLMRGISSRS
jgi:TetR/AcrR family transcriptional regulator, fatty acid metabolism regulator protein